jgi:putative ABC transport system permease protein
MKASMYYNYTSRSLLRGGQRTLLAFFCVAVGVMAIVALQLVGLMISNALTSNVRAANGGDLSVFAQGKPFTQSDLAFFAQLKKQRAITSYTALHSLNGSLSNTISVANSFPVLLVDPASYPLVTPPGFRTPANGRISSLLTGDGAILDSTIADTYHKRVGNLLNVHVSTGQQNSQLVPVKVAGIVTDTGVLSAYKSRGVILIAQAYYTHIAPKTPLLFDTVNITTATPAQANTVAKQVENKFFFATTQTVSTALKSRQELVDGIKKFLEIAGLLALLIGGVGIVNTMQVLLSRRRVEIAMLKTTGYRRKDLYLLFGLEAGMLGLIGGALGSVAAISVSFLVRGVVQQGFGLEIPFVLNLDIVAGGVLIGLFTALIFGLMPIVQAASIRPLSVIRDLPESNRAGSVALTVALLLILSALFCVMSIIILNDIVLAIGAVYGTFLFLLLLSGFFSLVALLVSRLPVPERFNLKFIALVVDSAIVAFLIALVLPTFGYLLFVMSVVGFLTVLMPRAWKANVKMALRNIGRQRARTTTTLLALFVGIFTIGLILVLGQNLRDSVNTAIAKDLTYNIVTNASGAEADVLQAQLGTVPGLQKYTRHYLASGVPLEINGQQLTTLLKKTPQNPGEDTLGRQGVLGLLGGIEGYDVANGSLPQTGKDFTILPGGRNLQRSDAGTNNVLIPSTLIEQEPLKGKLNVGSTIVMSSSDGRLTSTLHVVGVYSTTGLNLSLGRIYSARNTVQALSPNNVLQSVFYLKVDTAKINQALAQVQQIAPGSSSFSLANIGDYINQYLNYMILVLITIASLSLFAGVIIIANAVALAMLERRRELGILKSVGYTSATVLGEVLIENAAIGGLGALLAMLLVTFVTNMLGHFFFRSSFSVNGLVVIGLILGSALLAVLTALLVAWNSVRVRPLAVLRYE